MADDTGGEKTLPASEQKKSKARNEGNVAKSQDLSSAVTLAAALLAMVVMGQSIMETLVSSGRYFLGNLNEFMIDKVPMQLVAIEALRLVGICVLPIMATMLVVGIALNLAQVGILFTTKPLVPKLDKLNVITGFKRFVSPRTFVELVKSMAKLAIVGTIFFHTFRSRSPEFVTLMHMAPATALSAAAGFIVAIWWRIALSMVVLGLFDLAFQRWQHGRDLRMSHQEAKKEMKEMEGDPQIKRRVRQLQRQMAMQRMMADVPEADVIITNPTHYAVALRYDMDGMQAPVVIAKGARLLAQRIRDIGAEHNVPTVQKPELARTLYRTLEVGDAIPENLFLAVAEVLSFVYRIDRRAEKTRERREFMPEAV